MQGMPRYCQVLKTDSFIFVIIAIVGKALISITTREATVEQLDWA